MYGSLTGHVRSSTSELIFVWILILATTNRDDDVINKQFFAAPSLNDDVILWTVFRHSFIHSFLFFCVSCIVFFFTAHLRFFLAIQRTMIANPNLSNPNNFIVKKSRKYESYDVQNSGYQSKHFFIPVLPYVGGV